MRVVVEKQKVSVTANHRHSVRDVMLHVVAEMPAMAGRRFRLRTRAPAVVLNELEARVADVGVDGSVLDVVFL